MATRPQLKKMSTALTDPRRGSDVAADSGPIDYQAVTQAQQVTWATGDFHEIARQNVVMADAYARPSTHTPGSVCWMWGAGAGPRH
jgi:hypothetical protein